MKRIKKKTISRILAFILFFSGIFYASFYPETFLNTKSIKFVINLLPKNLEINYEEFSLDIKSKNFFNKDFNVYGKNFCFQGKDIPFSGCFNVFASGTFNLKKIKTYVKNIEVKKSNLTIPQGVKKKREKPLTLSRFYHFDFLKKINRWIEVEKGSIEYFKINNVEILNKKLSFLNSQLKSDNLIINIKQNNLLEINLN